MASEELEPVELEGLPAVWAAKVDELRERERALQQHEALVREVGNDLKRALELLIDQQNTIARLQSPNPSIADANALIKKYKLQPGAKAHGYHIIAYNQDITDPTELEEGRSIFDHPVFSDVEGEATEIADDLESGETRQLESGD